jgi:signal recognition particle subunit SRP54
MFESITKQFVDIWGRLRTRRISEKNIGDTLREIRVALLQADVALPVIADFLAKVETKAMGEEVLKGVDPGQQFIKIVYDEMAGLMGPGDPAIHLSPKPPTVILMAGLQGSGKTTTCGKLALKLKNAGRKPYLVACDIQRPAAIDQLEVLGSQVGVPVYTDRTGTRPPRIARDAVARAGEMNRDIVILDTAGRLHVDAEMMAEVREVADATKPQEILLVCDAMIGQDAVRSAREFNEQLELTGVILTKLDGDTRGGAALSVKAVTGKPIKFVGVGEKLEGTLEEFRAHGMAQRILGFGDVISLVEKVQTAVKQEEALDLQQKLLEGTFTLDDFAEQLRKMKKLGSVRDLMKLVPGIGAHVDEMDFDEEELVKVEAIIQSMTPKERSRPEILNTSRRDRIARGSGTSRTDVDDLIRQFGQMKKFMDQMTRSGGKGPLGKIKALNQARKQFGDIGGMMRGMMAGDPNLMKGQAPNAAATDGKATKDEIRRRRKLERQRRRKGRR